MELSIIITSYNRPEALKRCVDAIRSIPFDFPYEVVVSDDASGVVALDKIRAIDGIDRLLTNEKNLGLGANLNKVIMAAKGRFILYCQEDFLLDAALPKVLEHAMQLIDAGRLEMVRLKANYKFPKLTSLGDGIFAIPNFSWANFKVNTFRYSDNPFICKPAFFQEMDYFMEGVRGDYGETEFAIRVLRFGKRIGITQPYLAHTNTDAASTLRKPSVQRGKGVKKTIKQYLRAIRQHFEWLFYRKNHRGLITYPKR